MDYIYKLAFKPAADRADIVLTNAGGFIRTKTGPDIETLDACDLFFRTHLMDKHGYDADLVQNLAHRCTCVKLMDPERDGIDVSCVRNTLTIKFETASGRTYYAAFDGATDIMMLREDRNGNEEGRVDIITIPTNIYNKTCNDTAIKNLFRQIVEEYQEQYPNDIVFEADTRPVWNQFVNIPEDFLAKYGVSIQPMEPAALIIVGMDEEIL